MKKAIFNLLLISLVFVSCEKEEDKIPAAIQAIINENNCSCLPFIDLYLWRGKPVFLLGIRGPQCLSAGPVFYDEFGNKFELEKGYTFDNFFKDAQLQKNIWRCD